MSEHHDGHTRWRRSPRCGRAALAWLGILPALACAPLQSVPISVAPENSTVHVDGEARGRAPAQLELRSDRDHVLFFKKDGYRSERVILRSSDDGASRRLDPDRVEVSLTPLEAEGRALRIDEAPVGGEGTDPGDSAVP